ncbi:hypothetical protein KPSA1_05651 [Pseudomonas syringae pv. actinidiae]|uniref:Uncharacterized protein n=1 Tax=Pseudomonas syringae pv. actinidiae TaxID=103796 RepID=A0A2V0QHC8_PSESF|nr:hypothetical protein KPSA1_05651 [Pseudomonas syringae pv. actinidiae]
MEHCESFDPVYHSVHNEIIGVDNDFSSSSPLAACAFLSAM